VSAPAPAPAASLDDEAATAPAYGGKATVLARLRQAGIEAPPGVALSSEVYLEATSAAPGASAGDLSASFVAEMREWLAKVSVPEQAMASVTSHLREVPSSPSGWVVRSSAVGEDSNAASFAGQLDTVIGVDDSGLQAAIRRVWLSAWSDRAVQYRRRRGLGAVADLPVAVLIQPYLEPDAAGVLFTSDPMSGHLGAVIEAVRGRGDALVSDSALPTRYRLGPNEAAIEVDSNAAGDVLTVEQVRQLVLLGSRLELLLAGPQDIEWVLAAGVLTVVQSRPITTATAPAHLADPLRFTATVTRVDAAHAAAIPPHLASSDKFRLRLLATAEYARIGAGWLVTVREDPSGGSLADAAQAIRSEVEQEQPQVSLVLQDPPRLDGAILRQFTPAADIAERLGELVARVGAAHDTFRFIVTEVYRARMSGIAHLAAGRLFVEVAFGSYVPKGVVPTSLYVVDDAGGVESHKPAQQHEAIFIENGKPVTRVVDAVARLDEPQLAVIRHLTATVNRGYPQVSVEFGVLASGEPYLIDIIPDTSNIPLDDVRVMSPGRVTGRTVVAATEELAARSLEAHFHSQRDVSEANADAVVVVAPNPFLALEDYLSKYDSGNLAFVFEQGSLLGHLAIILREHGVPAIVVPEARTLLEEDALVEIDTSTESLFRVIPVVSA
jgi:phosphohistidine swiveling domain-containing protein